MLDRLGLLNEGDRWDAPEPQPSPQTRTLARAALLGRVGVVAETSGPPKPERRSSERAVQLTVTLRYVEPAIWRRLVVPASLTLRELHAVIQTAMGWEDYHLYLFDVDGVLYGDIDEIELRPLGDEETFTAGQAGEAVEQFSYEYDFGDGGTHEIRVDQMIASVGAGTPYLVGGARARPPEDCGGPGGYEEQLAVLADPAHEEHEHMLSRDAGSSTSGLRSRRDEREPRALRPAHPATANEILVTEARWTELLVIAASKRWSCADCSTGSERGEFLTMDDKPSHEPAAPNAASHPRGEL